MSVENLAPEFQVPVQITCPVPRPEQ